MLIAFEVHIPTASPLQGFQRRRTCSQGLRPGLSCLAPSGLISRQKLTKIPVLFGKSFRLPHIPEPGAVATGLFRYHLVATAPGPEPGHGPVTSKPAVTAGVARGQSERSTR